MKNQSQEINLGLSPRKRLALILHRQLKQHTHNKIYSSLAPSPYPVLPIQFSTVACHQNLSKQRLPHPICTHHLCHRSELRIHTPQNQSLLRLETDISTVTRNKIHGDISFPRLKGKIAMTRCLITRRWRRRVCSVFLMKVRSWSAMLGVVSTC
jgi:hypothetical protein